VLQEITAGATVSSAVFYYGFLLGRDRRQSHNTLVDLVAKRLSYTLQLRGTRRLYRFDQGKHERFAKTIFVSSLAK